MENIRSFKDNEQYGYINVPDCCRIYEVQTLPGTYDVSKDNTKVLDGMWCFRIEDRQLYDDILNALRRFIAEKYKSVKLAQPLNYWITVTYQNQILNMHVTHGNSPTNIKYNAFSTFEDAESFLLKIKSFLNRQGINLGNL